MVFVCATHPHLDHIRGIRSILTDSNYQIHEFWDSGFRHKSLTYRDILVAIQSQGIDMIRVSSGMERYYGKVRVTVLSPSVTLRNKYATYGVDMNNASVVLRLEHHEDDVLLARSEQYTGEATPEIERSAGRSVVILAGDAEFDAWAQVDHEYPKLETSISQGPMVKKMVNHLACSVIKVSHHGSMHSAPLDIYEKMSPEKAVISTKQKSSSKNIGSRTITRSLFPHDMAVLALEECGTEIRTTDGSYESQTWDDGILKGPNDNHPGSVVIVIPPGGKPRWLKLDDDSSTTPASPSAV
jgi:beta-lactamase superfamily II metal-dependent hydrolase